MRFKNYEIHPDDVSEASVGAVYFVVKEGPVKWRPGGLRRSVRLQSTRPRKVGDVETTQGPSVKRTLLGAAQVVDGPEGKELRVVALTESGR